MHVYFISGLGADKRVFQKLSLPASWNIIHVEWPEIADGETLATYCDKIAALIDTTQQYAIVGYSFGGMIAVELQKKLKPAKTVIMASVSSRKAMPTSYAMLGLVNLIKVVPGAMLNKVYPFTHWYFGTKTPEEKRMLEEIIADTPPKFLKWAINEILHWTNEVRPPGIYHIHGEKDRIFPVNRVAADKIVKNGGHFMVYSQADEISKLLIAQIEPVAAHIHS